ncbi:MAG TPA: hypothetical protein VGA84_04705 [Thermoanaerobaculia bacterium]
MRGEHRCAAQRARHPFRQAHVGHVADERKSRESKGFGFIDFSNDDDDRAAITGLAVSGQGADGQ